MYKRANEQMYKRANMEEYKETYRETLRCTVDVPKSLSGSLHMSEQL